MRATRIGIRMTSIRSDAAPAGVLSKLNSLKVRRVLWQVFAAVILMSLVGWMVWNLQHNLSVRNISTGFGFLDRQAGIPAKRALDR